jgi:hypothetical protein
MKRLSRAALAQQHQGFVDDDPSEPGRESGVFAEPLQVHQGPVKRALHRIFRILHIAKDAEGRAMGFALLALAQFSEGVFVPGLGLRDERMFVAYTLSTRGQRQAYGCVYARLKLEYEHNSTLPCFVPRATSARHRHHRPREELRPVT